MELHRHGEILFDPCPLNKNPIINGLELSWGTSTFVNPPYGREIGLWVKKAYDESQLGRTVVMLMPVRTDTNYFHNYILGKAEIRFIKGRLKFRGFSKKQNKIVDNEPASFPTMLVVFKSTKRVLQMKCGHQCISNCRRVGCNCQCGEWHQPI